MASTVRKVDVSLDGPPVLSDDRFSPTSRRHLSGPGLRTFLRICDVWGLDETRRRRLLGVPARSTYHNWLKAVREQRPLTLGLDELTRISTILGIYKALLILHGDATEAIAWLRGPHAATVFGGDPPLDLMTSGPLDALLTTRRFLDAARGGLYMEPNAADERPPLADTDIVFG